ncbi:MAG TPA: hypothetical protein PKV98_13660 [Burkholderiaceae bacterium]|nr:hypothetical protein [Burkholderiaceae bacterium]
MADFHAYAKNLAWLIEEPLQSTQELLSRIYGFANLHELQQVMSRPGHAGFENAPPDRDSSTIYFWTPELGNRILDLVKERKGLPSLAELPRRCWLARDIGLFGNGHEHRRAFRRIKVPLEVGSGQGPSGTGLSVRDYATLETDYEGKTIPTFTEIGAAVFRAALDLVPDQRSWNYDQTPPEKVASALDALAERYPQNPWVPAIKVTSLAEIFFLGGWADNPRHDAEGNWLDFDAHDGHLKHGERNAVWLLTDAKRSIALFEDLLGESADKTADFRLATTDGDTSTWPSLLYWGARIAAYAGDTALAIKWARRCRKIVPDDNFGTRQLLAPLLLSKGKGAIAPLFKGSDECLGYLARAAEAAAAGKWEEAGFLFGKSLRNGWAPVEVFTGPWKQLRLECERVISSNHDLPSHYQEFMHLSREFWKREAKVKAFFEGLCRDPSLKLQVAEYCRLRDRGRRSSGAGDAGQAFAALLEEQRRGEALAVAFKAQARRPD